MKEKFSGAESVLRASGAGNGAGEAATGPVRPSSECATSCSSFEWIRARFAGTTTGRDAAEWRFDLHGELDVERRRRGRRCGISKKSPL